MTTAAWTAGALLGFNGWIMSIASRHMKRHLRVARLDDGIEATAPARMIHVTTTDDMARDVDLLRQGQD